MTGRSGARGWTCGSLPPCSGLAPHHIPQSGFPMPISQATRTSTSHAALGGDFYDVVQPASFPDHVVRYRNRAWAERVGLEALTEAEWIAHLGRFEPLPGSFDRSEEHTSELQSLMRISYAVFCLKKKHRQQAT